jgi:hypothetical protein
MQAGNIVKSVMCMALLWGGASSVVADSLSEQLGSLFGPGGITLTNQPFTPVGGGPTIPHTAHFTSSSVATLELLVKQLAPNAADFPAISTVPGFTYRYNPEIQAFERSSRSLGPVFVERPLTLVTETVGSHPTGAGNPLHCCHYFVDKP